MTKKEQSELAGKLMAGGLCWFGAVGFHAVIWAFGSDPRGAVSILNVWMSVAMLGMIPFFVGVLLGIHALERK